MKTHDYAIYPTLLDSHWWFRKYPSQEKFDELIDKINKVKKPQAIQAERGSVFEELINLKLDNFVVEYDDDRGLYIYKDHQFQDAGVEDVYHKLKDSIAKQKYIQAIVPMHGVNVKLYGIVDYTTPTRYKDLKTCERYKKGKYANYHQHKVYPLIAKVNGTPIEQFDYVVTDFYNTFVEPYVPTPKMFDEVADSCYWLISFVEENRHLITNPKIFGE